MFVTSSYRNAFSQESCKFLKLNDPQVVFTLAFVKSTFQGEGWGHDSKLIFKKIITGKLFNNVINNHFPRTVETCVYTHLITDSSLLFHHTWVYIWGSSSKSWGYKTVQCYYPWYHLATLLINNEFQIVFVELKRDVMHSFLLWLQIARKEKVLGLINNSHKD